MQKTRTLRKPDNKGNSGYAVRHVRIDPEADSEDPGHAACRGIPGNAGRKKPGFGKKNQDLRDPDLTNEAITDEYRNEIDCIVGMESADASAWPKVRPSVSGRFWQATKEGDWDES